jgi:hypothetical protein
MTINVIATAALSCEFCGEPLQRGRRGPRRRFCDAHRQAVSRRVAQVASPGVMGRVAARMTTRLSARRGEPDATFDGLLASLPLVAAALDATPGSAALWTVWRGLLRDLQRGQEGGGAAQAELAAIMARVLPAAKR